MGAGYEDYEKVEAERLAEIKKKMQKTLDVAEVRERLWPFGADASPRKPTEIDRDAQRRSANKKFLIGAACVVVLVLIMAVIIGTSTRSQSPSGGYGGSTYQEEKAASDAQTYRELQKSYRYHDDIDQGYSPGAAQEDANRLDDPAYNRGY